MCKSLSTASLLECEGVIDEISFSSHNCANNRIFNVLLRIRFSAIYDSDFLQRNIVYGRSVFLIIMADASSVATGIIFDDRIVFSFRTSNINSAISCLLWKLSRRADFMDFLIEWVIPALEAPTVCILI